jgi:predicted N-acetyltransferase YhbS
VFGPAEFVSEVVLLNAYRTAPTFDPELSLVAEAQGQIVGHTLFIPNTIMLAGEPVAAFLAIAGVRPELQKQRGIGTRLAEEGLGLPEPRGISSL